MPSVNLILHKYQQKYKKIFVKFSKITNKKFTTHKQDPVEVSAAQNITSINNAPYPAQLQNADSFVR